MNRETIVDLKAGFDQGVQITADGKMVFWYARDLQQKLGYTQWRNFVKVIEKAKMACGNAGGIIKNHFADVSKMVDVKLGAKH